VEKAAYAGSLIVVTLDSKRTGIEAVMTAIPVAGATGRSLRLHQEMSRRKIPIERADTKMQLTGIEAPIAWKNAKSKG
jgi:hypothetical protein